MRQAEGLAEGRNQIRQMPEGLPVSHRPRSTRHLLAMSPDPRLSALLADLWKASSMRPLFFCRENRKAELERLERFAFKLGHVL